MEDFLQEFIINTAIYPDAIIEREGSIECKPLEIRVRVDVNFAVVAVNDEFFHGDLTFEINDWHVALYSGSVQSCCRCLSASLTRLVPWRCADRVALGGADYGMESV